MSNCRSCNAPIWWGRTDSNKLIPIDAEPADNGNIMRTGERTEWGTAPRVTVQIPPGFDGDRYLSHFVTCEHAAAHRRK